jgi:hypothetical protein
MRKMSMFEPKPIAALSGSLLARKGDARPAIRRAYVPMAPISRLPHAEPQDDLGWNDMGEDAPSPARQQQERIERSFSAGKKAAAQKAKAAFTLRLDADRHLRLRLASAVGKRSAQQIVTEALDAFLDKHPGLDALVEEARKGCD